MFEASLPLPPCRFIVLCFFLQVSFSPFFQLSVCLVLSLSLSLFPYSLLILYFSSFSPSFLLSLSHSPFISPVLWLSRLLFSCFFFFLAVTKSFSLSNCVFPNLIPNYVSPHLCIYSVSPFLCLSPYLIFHFLSSSLCMSYCSLCSCLGFTQAMSAFVFSASVWLSQSPCLMSSSFFQCLSWCHTGC